MSKTYTIPALVWDHNEPRQPIAKVPGIGTFVIEYMGVSKRWRASLWQNNSDRHIATTGKKEEGMEACQAHFDALVAGFMTEVKEKTQ